MEKELMGKYYDGWKMRLVLNPRHDNAILPWDNRMIVRLEFASFLILTDEQKFIEDNYEVYMKELLEHMKAVVDEELKKYEDKS